MLAALTELPPIQAVSALRGLLIRPGDDYWHRHADFGQPLRSPQAVLGAERASDLVVNVILPWAVARARQPGHAALETAAITAYTVHPALGLNQITRHMAPQLLGLGAAHLLKRACLQQGLIQLYQGWCDARDCAMCPAGHGMVELGAKPPDPWGAP